MSEPATEPVTAPEPPVSPAPKRRDPQQIVILAVVAVLILVIAGLGASLYLNRAPAKMTVTGGVEVSSNPNIYYDSQESIDLAAKPGAADCDVDPSAGDIPGSQIVITDASGKTVGVGTIGKAMWVTEPTFQQFHAATPGSCLIPFTVRGVAKGSKFYSIAITGHGSIKFPASQMSQPLALNLNG